MWEHYLYRYCIIRQFGKVIAICTMVMSIFNIAYSNVDKEILHYKQVLRSSKYPSVFKHYNTFAYVIWGIQLVAALVLIVCIYNGNIPLALPFLLILGLKVVCFCILTLYGVGLIMGGFLYMNLFLYMGNVLVFSIDLVTFMDLYTKYEYLKEYT